MLIRLSYEAPDPAGARLGRPKDLDPFAVMATGFPYDLPPGRLRLWTKDGDERRDKRPVAQGGDYLAPGDYRPEQLGLRPGAPPAGLLAETVRVSDRVADVVIRVQVLAADRRLSEDQVRMTATKFVLLGRGYDPRLDGGTAEEIRAAGDDEKAPQLFGKSAGREQGPFRPSLGLITSDLSSAPTHGSTPGLFEVQKVRVYDPRRTGVAPLLVFGETVNLVRGDAYHESEEFVVVERGDEINWKVPFKVVQTRRTHPRRSGPGRTWPNEPDRASADSASKRCVVRRRETECDAGPSPVILAILLSAASQASGRLADTPASPCSTGGAGASCPRGRPSTTSPKPRRGAATVRWPDRRTGRFGNHQPMARS